MHEYEYITQIEKFKRDKVITNEFIKKFVLYNSIVNIYIVNSELDLEEQNFYKNFLEDKINIVIHNLKTFKKIDEVQEYINKYLLLENIFKFEKISFTKMKFFNMENQKENKYYYKQIIQNNEKIQIIHLFMANDRSDAGNYYNHSTFNFIKKLIETNFNFIKFNIIEKVREFLFDHSEEFFNEPLENIDDIKIIEENNKRLLKYTNKEKPFELKECYVDELGNANFIQTNYKPSYRAYKVKCNDNNEESNKLFLDIERRSRY